MAIRALLGVVLAAQAAFGVDFLLKDATILTVTKGTLKKGSLLVRGGKIAAIGANLKPPPGAKVIDCTGKFVMPGIIDAHSHIATTGGINDAATVVTAELNMTEVIDAADKSISRAVAGGVTTVNTMHGSANPIGATTATIKLKWGKTAEEMLVPGAPLGIKFALGENPKRTHAERGIKTRLGVADAIRNTFNSAREYMKDWDAYRAAVLRGEKAWPPRKDLQMETIADVLRGKILVQCHGYVEAEMEMILRLQDEYGFKIGAFHHALEAYKLAPELAERNIGVSTFADNWAYKWEAYDGNRFNCAVLTEWGARASCNSDSGETIRRLNGEAAKCVRNSNSMTDDQALALITINPAFHLGIEKMTGSLEVGKDADISVWNGHPLSVYSRCVLTMIDGDVYFELDPKGGAKFPMQPEVKK